MIFLIRAELRLRAHRMRWHAELRRVENGPRALRKAMSARTERRIRRRYRIAHQHPELP